MLKILKHTFITIFFVSITSCFFTSETDYDPNLPTKVGVISFGESIYARPLEFLNLRAKSDMADFINSQTTSNGTALYYSVYKAAQFLEAELQNGDYDNAFIVTFTDGTDNVSGALYRNSENFGQLVSNEFVGKKAKEIIDRAKIKSFTIGLYGKEGKTSQQITNDLSLISTSKPQVSPDIKSLKTKFNQVSSTLIGYSTSFILQRNTQISNSVIKIEFTMKNGSILILQGLYINDGVENPYFTIDKEKSTVKLDEQKIEGQSNPNTNKDVLFFKNLGFNNLSINQDIPIKISVMQQNGSFIEDSEAGKIQQTTSSKNLIFLVLDNSASLGQDSGLIKEYANGFINQIYSSLS